MKLGAPNPMPSKITRSATLSLGPVLSFRGCNATTWNVSVLIVFSIKEKPPLTFNVDGGSEQTAALSGILMTCGSLHALRYELSIPRPRGVKEAKVDYSVCGTTATFYCPGTEMPLQAAYTSCNGFSSADVQKQLGEKERHAMWNSLLAQHRDRRSDREPANSHYHLLLMGGDQLYADSIFAPNSPLGAWNDLSVKKRLAFKVNNALRTKMVAYYFRDLYCSRWSQEGVKEGLASIPTVMMWDDHDIFDGWGSYPPAWQKCPVHQATFEIARDCFRAFQLQLAPEEAPVGSIPEQKALSSYHQIDDVGLLTLDLRSERTQDQIISDTTWKGIYAHLNALGASTGNQPGSLKHLLVMMSIPAVYPSFEFAEKFFGWVPGQQEMEDDMRDHWRSPPHKGERLRLIHNLFGFAKAAKCRVTLLSGDVHVPALGTLKNNRADFSNEGNTSTITQLISTGIVHPPAGALTVFAMDKLLAGWDEEVDRDILAKMEYLPGTQSHLMARRNWLALEFDTNSSKRLWAIWRLEGEKYPFVKVIHSA